MAGPEYPAPERRDETRPQGTEKKRVLALLKAPQVCSPWGKRRLMVAL